MDTSTKLTETEYKAIARHAYTIFNRNENTEQDFEEFWKNKLEELSPKHKGHDPRNGFDIKKYREEQDK